MVEDRRVAFPRSAQVLTALTFVGLMSGLAAAPAAAQASKPAAVPSPTAAPLPGGQPPPSYVPPPGYPAQPAYVPPPGYPAQPSYVPPPGYPAQPGYVPPPGYPPPGYAAPPGYARSAYPPPGYGYPPAVYPGREEQPSGFHEHDGVYVRLFLGVGRLYASVSEGTDELKLKGTGGAFGVAVGGALVDNVILYGELNFVSVDGPTRTVNGTQIDAGDVSVTTGSIGPGVAYYFPEINLYLSSTVGFSKVNTTDRQSNTTTGSSDWGFGFSGMVGKEFWVSTNWGLGAALQYRYARMHDHGENSPFIYENDFALVGSATFN